MNRVLIVSNRLPVTMQTSEAGEQELGASAGGLVAGLLPLHERTGGLWIGHPGGRPGPAILNALTAQRLVPLVIPDEEYEAYYEGFSNSGIWPLFHYSLDRCTFDAEEYEAYRRVNERFAEVIAEHAWPGDTIWIHDYQLMLLPQMVRERVPDARIGFFLHIPFPSSELFRVLPNKEELLRGLLGADLIGVHTFDYAENLRRSVRRILGLSVQPEYVRVDGRNVRIEAHPLGVNVETLHKHAFSDEAEEALASYRAWVGDRKVILGVDRLDYTKGLPHKLQAFSTLLARSPDLAQEVLFIQLAIPSREGIESYQEQRSAVEALVGQINGLYGRPGRVPVHYLYRSVSPAELGALYRLANVAFVSPLRDGLNLVAKEYVASREEADGVLVISEFAGAAAELGEGLRVNPWDIERTADQLLRALAMSPDEQRLRMAPMVERVRQGNVFRWVDRFVESLEAPFDLPAGVPPVISSSVLASTLAAPLRAARAALFMLDFDGSLREFTAHYEDAAPTPEILELLEALAARRDVTVFINSGRDRDTLQRWFGGVPVSLLAEHGAWMRRPGEDDWQRIGLDVDTSWKADVRPLLQEVTDRTPGSQIEEKTSALVWHYRESEETLGEWQARELAAQAEAALVNRPVEVLHGARIVEIRARGVDKGQAFDLVQETFGPYDFILAVGDDRTDEDLFERIPVDGFAVKVGPGHSSASAAVSSPRSLRELLARLATVKPLRDPEAVSTAGDSPRPFGSA